MSDKITFRFMSGEHIGSSLKLAQGRYSIGGSSECDIYLNDEELADLSFLLEIDESLRVVVHTQNGIVKIDGQSIDGSRPLEAGQLLSFGLVSLMYVAAGQEFVAAAMDKIIGHSLVQDDKTASDESDELQDKGTKNKTVEQDHEVSVVSVDRRFFIFNLLGIILLAAILITLIAGSYLFAKGSGFDRDFKAISDYIQSKGYTELEVSKEDNDIIAIKGLLQDESTFRAFLSALPETSSATRLDISLLNKDIKAIERSFLLHGFYVRAEQIDDNVYKIYGYARDAYTIYPAFSQAQKEFDTFTFKNALTYEHELKDLIDKYNAPLAGVLAIRPEKSFVLYENKISQSEADELQKLILSLESAVKAPVHFITYKDLNKGAIESLGRIKKQTTSSSTAKNPVQSTVVVVNDDKNNVTKTNTALGVAPEDIIGVTLRPMKFITLKNGIKYFEGAMMPGGYILKSIAIDRIIFEKEGDIIDYALK